jgi:hypothetical protein
VFRFSIQLLSETFLFLRRNERDIVINVHRYSCKAPVNSCPILMKLEFSRKNFEKYSNIKFHEKSVQWEACCSMRTDRETDITKLRVAYRIPQTRMTSACSGLRPAFQYIMHVETG